MNNADHARRSRKKWSYLPSCCCILLLAWCLTVVPARSVRADLVPEEVAIIAVAGSRESIEVAEYYAKARGIPLAHICRIDVPPGENLDRTVWHNSVRPAIRNWILEQRLESRLRCLVTVWDVPLKISRNTDGVAARQAFLEAERRLRRASVGEHLDRIESILPGSDTAAPKEPPADADAKELAGRIQSAIDAAQRRMALSDPKPMMEGSLQLMRAAGELGGVAAGVKILSTQAAAANQTDGELAKKLEFAKGRLLGLRDARVAVEQLPESIERDEQILSIVAAAEGHLGAIEWVDNQLESLKKNETYSSFDSELSLLFWLDYPLNRWRPNLLNCQFDDSPLRARRPTLMVSRLEAPTVAHTKRLVDDAIATEKAGLAGKVYLDARGIPGESEPKSRGSYGEYDQAIRDLADLLKKHSEMAVVLDNEKELFQDGQCPDAGLYCGWYSLAKYVDAFEFARGAVGYHIASGEATTLRKPESQVWCKRLLEEGICATLGPVHEPYLSAFPRPDEFFVALLCGKYSLVECYYRTKPFNSWVMVLIGDPLYNPYRTKPGIDGGALPERLRRVIGLSDEEANPLLKDLQAGTIVPGGAGHSQRR